MKREYSKPKIVVENYCLSESVAACQDVTYSTINNNNMSVTDALDALTGMGLFTASCTISADDVDPSVFEALGVCYHGFYTSGNAGTGYSFNS